MSIAMPKRAGASENRFDSEVDWRRVAWLTQASRALDELEETKLVPERKIFYQFSARGHDVAQVLLGLQLTNKNDAICGYYRSRPILLALGVSIADALGSSMARAGGYSDGRDIGAVFNYPNSNGPSALPMCVAVRRGCCCGMISRPRSTFCGTIFRRRSTFRGVIW